MSFIPLSKKISDRTATVAVLGLGYVGLPLLRAFWNARHPVIGFDVDTKKIDQIHAGKNYLKHLGADFIVPMIQGCSSRLKLTDNPQDLVDADVLIFCVPTPLGYHQEPDMSFIRATSESVVGILRPGQLVTLESTTYPGTTREVVLPILEKSGLRCGKDFFLAYSPEREDPGRKNHDTQSIPKLVGGLDDQGGQLATEVYSHAIKNVIQVESAEIAESAKLLENIYRSVNIALANEMKLILDPMGIDIWKVIEAAATKPFGFQAFWPGPGLGGHCIPIDPFYLSWKAKEHGYHTRFIELAGQINTAMPQFVVRKTQDALNRLNKSIQGSKILIVGLTYKPDIDDVRETPSVHLIEGFQDLGAKVEFHDQYCPEIPFMRKHQKLVGMKSIPIEKACNFDAVVIATNHSNVDYENLAKTADLIIDTRGAMRGIQTKNTVIQA